MDVSNEGGPQGRMRVRAKRRVTGMPSIRMLQPNSLPQPLCGQERNFRQPRRDANQVGR